MNDILARENNADAYCLAPFTHVVLNILTLANWNAESIDLLFATVIDQ